MSEDKRFEKLYSQGAVNVTEIWVDKETGNPLFRQNLTDKLII